MKRSPLRANPDAASTAVKPKKRTCRICRVRFETFAPTFVCWCSPECGLTVAQEALKKKKLRDKRAEQREIRARKEAMKPRSHYLGQLQHVFNKFIRARDVSDPCISCGRFHGGSYDAGHYRSVGSMPALRFNEDNVHKQCVPCNQHKAGNIVEYRLRLIGKIGPERLAFIEGPHEPKKYAIEEIKQLIKHYKQKTKELLAQRAGD